MAAMPIYGKNLSKIFISRTAEGIVVVLWVGTLSKNAEWVQIIAHTHHWGGHKFKTVEKNTKPFSLFDSAETCCGHM